MNGAYVASVDARDRNERSRIAAATVSNLDLTARDVELGTTIGRSGVQRNGFHTDEVSEGE